jgi:hypothetical protein
MGGGPVTSLVNKAEWKVVIVKKKKNMSKCNLNRKKGEKERREKRERRRGIYTLSSRYDVQHLAP